MFVSHPILTSDCFVAFVRFVLHRLCLLHEVNGLVCCYGWQGWKSRSKLEKKYLSFQSSEAASGKIGKHLMHLETAYSDKLTRCYLSDHSSDDHEEEKEDTKTLLEFCNVQKQLIQAHDSIVKLYNDESVSQEEPWNRKSKELVNRVCFCSLSCQDMFQRIYINSKSN